MEDSYQEAIDYVVCHSIKPTIEALRSGYDCSEDGRKAFDQLVKEGKIEYVQSGDKDYDKMLDTKGFIQCRLTKK